MRVVSVHAEDNDQGGSNKEAEMEPPELLIMLLDLGAEAWFLCPVDLFHIGLGWTLVFHIWVA